MCELYGNVITLRYNINMYLQMKRAAIAMQTRKQTDTGKLKFGGKINSL
jgi:hypothetical protein